MTLRLINAYTSRNLGDAVICETLAQLAAPLRAVTAMHEEECRYIRKVTGSSLVPDRESDVNVSVGGDIFNNARPLLVTRRFLQNVRTLATAPAQRTFLFGQSIPHSCRGLSLQLLARVLRRLSSVTVRDAQSAARLRSLGVNASLSYDIALGYTPSTACSAAGSALFERAGLDPSRAVLISVRAFDQMYPQDNQRFLVDMATLVKRLLDRGHQPAILVQALAGGTDDDHVVAARLRLAVPQLGLLDPFDEGLRHHPVDALIGALGQARAVVAVRFHTAVLRLLAGRMPYNLAYSAKGADLGERLALPGSPLQALDVEKAVAGIESSIDCTYDIAPLRADVREQFAAALSRASGGCRAPLPLTDEFAIR